MNSGNSFKLESTAKRKSSGKKEHNLKSIWTIFLLNVFSLYTGMALVKNGWSPVNRKSIYIKGNESFSKTEILEATRLSIPKALLNINPKKIQIELLNNLPLKNVSIHRWIFPPSLSIEIQERSPIAFAKKAKIYGSEEGMIDIDSYWIPMRFAHQLHNSSIDLSIDGWTNNNKELITFILKRRNSFGSPLKKIILSPNGELSLQTDQFSSIHLGRDRSLLRKQLKTLSYLGKSLPQKILKEKSTTLNLRDPLKPQIYTPKKKVL